MEAEVPMREDEPPANNQAYYDRFAPSYEDHRHQGYHRLIDDLEIELVRKYGEGRCVLEAGCGTGLLLQRTGSFASKAVGLDLSRGMLQTANQRGLPVVQGSITDLPFADAHFDLVYSMKVLPHIPPIQEALAEMARVLRPGGTLLAEFYNPYSLRSLAKWVGGPARIAAGTTDRDVYTRYDTVTQARAYLPAGVQLVSVRGVRIFTPASTVYRFAPLGALFSAAEHAACDLPGLRNLGGFVVLVARKS